jgi:hypothetical protein
LSVHCIDQRTPFGSIQRIIYQVGVHRTQRISLDRDRQRLHKAGYFFFREVSRGKRSTESVFYFLLILTQVPLHKAKTGAAPSFFSKGKFIRSVVSDFVAANSSAESRLQVIAKCRRDWDLRLKAEFGG